MNKVLHSIRSLLLGTTTFLLLASGAAPLYAADPEIVGVLADAIDPPIAKALDLSDDQLASIRSLIDSQESKALDLNDKARDMPKAAAQEMLQKSISDLEAEAFKVLTVEQRSKLEQVRLNRIGLRSLAEASVAETLGLSEGQREQIQAVLGSRIQILREVGPDRVDAETQNRLRKVLTSFQYATWQTMAGGGKVPARSAAVADDASGEAASSDQSSQPAADEPAPQSEQPSVKTVPVKAATNDTSPTPRATSDEDEPKLVINFNGADWGTVLKWMAREADLNLQLNTVPTGTFTYRDSNKYSVAKAMDIMNGVLLSNGYTLVRKQRTLMVVDLGNGEQSADVTRGLIRELAQLVTPDQLDNRGDYELLKCLFQLSRLTPEETEKQVKLLIGPHGSVIPLASSNQILVVETGEKLRLIRDLIERSENPDPTKSMKVASFTLKHVTAEEVLSIARGHLGLEADKDTSDDVTVSTDPIGNTIYATGRADKIQLLGEIVAKVDIEPASDGPMSVQIQKPEFRAHPVVNGDLDSAMEVLQTMLAGTPNIHLGKDTVSKSITALAPPAEHQLIEDTLRHIGGNAVQFETIRLKRADPKSAIIYLEKLLGKPTEGEAAKAGSSAPTYVGDATSKTLMVKGTPQQIEQVRRIIDQLESATPNTSMLGDRMRFVPTNGKSPERVVKEIEMLLNAQKLQTKINVHTAHSAELDAKSNPRRSQLGAEPAKEMPASSKVKKPNGKSPASSTDPTTSVESHEKDKSKPSDVSEMKVPLGKLVQTEAADESAQTDGEEAAKNEDQENSDNDNSKNVAQVEVFETPGGLVVTSDDPEVLAQFEQLSTFLNDQAANGPVKPTIFYLKYVPATPTADFIRQVMSGKVATQSAGGGGLLGDITSNMLGGFGGGIIGSALGGGSSNSVQGPSLASGEFSIVPDPRMNLMLVYANPVDLELIDQIVDTLDREDSPLLVQLSGRPQIIPVQYADATEVAGIVKEAFANRLAQSQNGGGGGGAGGGGNNNNRQPSPQEMIAVALRGAGGRNGAAGNQPNPMPEPKMTISVDTRNNAIIVTGPNSLYQEVKEFVEQIDQGSMDTQEDVQVVQLGGKMNAAVLQGALQSVLGPQAKTNIVGQATSGQAVAGQTGTSPSPRDMQQRADFMRQFQGGGFGGGNFGAGNRGMGGNFGGGNGGFGGGFGGNFGGQNRGAGNNNQGRTGGGNNQGRTGGGNQGRTGGAQGRGGR